MTIPSTRDGMKITKTYGGNAETLLKDVKVPPYHMETMKMKTP